MNLNKPVRLFCQTAAGPSLLTTILSQLPAQFKELSNASDLKKNYEVEVTFLNFLEHYGWGNRALYNSFCL